MKLFECIVDDGQDVFKTLTASKNKKELLEVYGGNGNFEKITDVTNDYLIPESVEKLREDLQSKEWEKGEIEIICALVKEHIAKRKGKRGKNNMKNKELWANLYEMSKDELRHILADNGVIKTKSLTKYQLIVKTYQLLA